jgi:hypothetical protein
MMNDESETVVRWLERPPLLEHVTNAWNLSRRREHLLHQVGMTPVQDLALVLHGRILAQVDRPTTGLFGDLAGLALATVDWLAVASHFAAELDRIGAISEAQAAGDIPEISTPAAAT